LVKPYKKSKGYDCLIGISGGKDSHYQTWFVKEVLGLKPLTVTFNHLDNSQTGIRNLENLITKFQVDHIRFTPNPEVVRKSCRVATQKLADPFWHEHAGIYTFPVQMAVKYQIPLIIWGEYGFMDLLGMFSHEDFIEMGKKLRMEHGMRGMEVQDFLKGNREGLTERDMEWAVYPSNEEIEKLGLRGIYLGNYIKWDSNKQTKQMITQFDFATEQKERTFNCYENVECYFNDSVHDYMKYLKYGYGRATDHASQLIRLGYITREEGAWLVNRFDPIKHVRWYEFLKYVDLSEKEVLEAVERNRDPRWSGVWEDILPEKHPDSLPYFQNPAKPRTGRVFI
jgi:N-acetyl sugar amidotransferase